MPETTPPASAASRGKRIVEVRLVIVTDAPNEQVRAAAENMLGHALPGLEGSSVWEAHVSEPRASAPVMLATSLEPIPGIVRRPSAHDPDCDCIVCEES